MSQPIIKFDSNKQRLLQFALKLTGTVVGETTLTTYGKFLKVC